MRTAEQVSHCSQGMAPPIVPMPNHVEQEASIGERANTIWENGLSSAKEVYKRGLQLVEDAFTESVPTSELEKSMLNIFKVKPRFKKLINDVAQLAQSRIAIEPDNQVRTQFIKMELSYCFGYIIRHGVFNELELANFLFERSGIHYGKLGINNTMFWGKLPDNKGLYGELEAILAENSMIAIEENKDLPFRIKH